SSSTRRDKKRFLRKLRTFTKSAMPNTSLGCFHRVSDRPRNAAPSIGFDFELLPSSLSQAVAFRAAVVFRVSPKIGNPPLFLHSVQSGRERAWFNHKSAAARLL